ncbi:MAG TPA: hypothetical protein VFU80_05765 [Sphingomicrobium sp.]|nr:hypothetical protein [Sphingomicrobium sp.]
MDQIAASRAQSLAQLVEAVEGAQRLAWQLGSSEDKSNEARELYGRLEAVRVELNSLRGARLHPLHGDDPDWLRLLDWNGRLPDRDD